MGKPTLRARRVAKPVWVAPLISMYVPGLQSHTLATPAPAGRQVLRSKTVFGVTINRYLEGCELVYADGRKISARGPVGLLMQMLRSSK